MRGLVIISAYNEGTSLGALLDKLIPFVAAERLGCEVVVVDDGSSDDTAEVAERAGVRVLRNGKNRGLGFSRRRGYLEALDGGYDFTVTMDADGQHDEKVLPAVIGALGGSEFVIASRYHPDSPRYGVPLDRDLLNIATTAQVCAVVGWPITDPLSGFRAMQRQLVQFAAGCRDERYGETLEVLLKAWFLNPRPRVVEVPHPAIYADGDARPTLNRVYSEGNREERIDRFGTHALHICQVLEEIAAANSSHGQAIQDALGAYRERLAAVRT